MNILNVELARTIGISGGEVCFIELSRRLPPSQWLINAEDSEPYTRAGLRGSILPLTSAASPRSRNLFALYLTRAIKAVDYVRRFSGDFDILVSHSEFFPTLVCALLLTRKARRPWVAWLHMIAPNPFRGYEHEFSPRKTLAVPTINALFYWLNQRLFLWCADRYAARLIVTAKFSLNRLKRRFGDRLSIVPYGLGPPKAEIGTTKDFDVIFVGRFHPQKGLFFLLKAWREVVAKRPGAKLAIIGTGTESIEKDLRAAIKTMQLTDSISLLGFLSGYAKDQVVARSRVFAFPSTYESFGIVALEAMQLGVPVVGFDLPVYDGVFDAMVKVPFGSTHAMAEEILALLTDAKRYAAVSRAAKENAQRFSWDSSAVLYSEILAAAAQSSK